jgi:hypothetical protein
MKVLASWFFGLDAFMWSRLFLGLELEGFHGFDQVFSGFFLELKCNEGIGKLVLSVGCFPVVLTIPRSRT